MPRRKPFQKMTDEELTDKAIARRVFPAEVRRQIREAVKELEREPAKGRKSKKTAKKR